MTLPIIIGVAGRDRAGKSTVAAALAAHGYTVINFADTLKDMAVAIDPPIEDPNTGRVYGLASLVQEYGWEVVKDRFPGARRFLRRLATEGVREHLDPNAWVTAWRKRVMQHLRKRVMQHRDASEDTVPVVAGDVRFRNEADAIIASGGQIWLVDRPLLTADGEQHVSENPLPDELITRTIRNDGTVEDLTERVEKLISMSTSNDGPRRFRKKPLVVEAMFYDGTPESANQIIDWALEHHGSISYHCQQLTEQGQCVGPGSPHTLAIPTREGTMHADIGDWVIREPFPWTNGRKFYPCKPDIFAATYEETDDVD